MADKEQVSQDQPKKRRGNGNPDSRFNRGLLSNTIFPPAVEIQQQEYLSGSAPSDKGIQRGSERMIRDALEYLQNSSLTNDENIPPWTNVAAALNNVRLPSEPVQKKTLETKE